MLAKRWEPIRGLNRFEREMNQLFRGLAGSPARHTLGVHPRLNLWEDADHYYVEAELPGLSLEDLDVQVLAGHELSIAGHRHQPDAEEATWARRERVYGDFRRVVKLPAEIDADKVAASLVNGVLTVTLAKSEAVKPRTITVEAG